MTEEEEIALLESAFQCSWLQLDEQTRSVQGMEDIARRIFRDGALAMSEIIAAQKRRRRT